MKRQNKEIATLRRKPTSNGGSSLFLDYTVEGRRVREYLKLYLVPPRTKQDREKNKATMEAAETIRARRIVEISMGTAGIPTKRERTTILQYMERKVGGYSDTYARLYRSAASAVASYGDAPLGRIDKKWLLGFIAHMADEGRWAQSTRAVYYQAVTMTLSSAVRDGLIDYNPCSRLERRDVPSIPQSDREHLSLEEVRRMAATPCAREEVKRAFMFSCFTGLRLSDVRGLTWDMVRRVDDGLQVEMRQEKTEGMVYVPLSDNALAWLGERGLSDHPFDLPSLPTIERTVAKWARDSGIGKKVTFHVARHTFATLLLTFGTDIYTVSKLLGHSSVSTTQIYAKVVDEKKRTATNAIPKL